MYKILCVGKIKEKFLSDGILEYKKRPSSARIGLSQTEMKLFRGRS